MFLDNLFVYLRNDVVDDNEPQMMFRKLFGALSCISVSEAGKMLKISRSTIYNKIKVEGRFYDADFPQPLNLGEGAIRFLSFEIANYIIKRAEERDKMIEEKRRVLAKKKGIDCS